MEERWWEHPVCFICDYWWALLIVIVLLLSVFFTRGIWLPIVGFEPLLTATPTLAPLPPTRVILSTQPGTETPITTRSPTTTVPFTSTSADELFGYINTQGNYAFNYPSSWQGTETVSDVRFIFDGVKCEVVVQSIRDGETLDTIRTTEGPIGSSLDNFLESSVGGVPALQQEIYNPSGELTGLLYHVLHGERYYALLIVADPNQPLRTNFATLMSQFEAIIKSFRFID